MYCEEFVTEAFLSRIIYYFKKALMMSIGKGKIIVELFSAEIELSVCKYLSCRAAGDC